MIEDSHQAALELCFLGKANRLSGQEPASDADLEQCCSYASSESTASTAPPTLSGTNEPSPSHPEGAVVDASPLPQPTHFQAASSRDGSLPSPPPSSHPQTELTVNAESKSSDSPPALDEDNLCSDVQEASSAHTRPVLSSEATIEDDLQAEQPQCWGALLTNDHSNVRPELISTCLQSTPTAPSCLLFTLINRLNAHALHRSCAVYSRVSTRLQASEKQVLQRMSSRDQATQ